jgi:hypothetical protein
VASVLYIEPLAGCAHAARGTALPDRLFPQFNAYICACSRSPAAAAVCGRADPGCFPLRYGSYSIVAIDAETQLAARYEIEKNPAEYGFETNEETGKVGKRGKLCLELRK